MQLAERLDAEILSVDSMQVYRGMDIGTAKPSIEDRRRVRHHMIDAVDPEQDFTVAQFRSMARRAIQETESSVVLIVGGSGLHFRSVVDPMVLRPTDPSVRRALEETPLPQLVNELVAADPEAAAHVDLANPRRVVRAVETLRIGGLTPSALAETAERHAFAAYEPELPFLGMAVDSHRIDERIGLRLEDMRQQGLLEEVRQLAPRLGPTASQAVGYQQLLEVVDGSLSEDEGFAEAERATRRLVKRQRTYFRRDPRLRWLDAESKDLLATALEEIRS